MGATPFHLDSFEAEAQAILERARGRARELLGAALAEAQKIRDQARLEGFEAGKAEGVVKAREVERARILQETSGIAALLEGVVRGIEARRAELLANAERDLVSLAIAIAERLVRAQIEAGRPVAREAVRHALELSVRRDEMEVRLHPSDLAQVETYLPELRSRFPGVSRIHLKADDGVARGGCIVVTAQGAVDADLPTRIEELSRALLGA